MKVLFMGTPAFAAASLQSLLDAGHHVAAAVTRPDAPAGRGLRTQPPAVRDLASRRGVPVAQPRDVRSDAFFDQAAALSPDIVVVVAFGRILPRRLLEMAPLGAVNVHASLLPRYRGAAPVVWAIARGEAETGVTTLRMVERLDAGDILLQRSTPIGPEETAGQLEARLGAMGAELLIETLAGLESGRIIPVPQDESAATWAPVLRKEDGAIDWRLPAEQIARCVRAFDPWPSAQARSPGPPARLLRIRRARPFRPLGGPGAEPGTIIGAVRGAAGEGGVLVACGEGTVLLITELQPEGRRSMPALEALSGRHLKEGDRLAGG